VRCAGSSWGYWAYDEPQLTRLQEKEKYYERQNGQSSHSKKAAGSIRKENI
jgi:hypothetical protein